MGLESRSYHSTIRLGLVGIKTNIDNDSKSPYRVDKINESKIIIHISNIVVGKNAYGVYLLAERDMSLHVRIKYPELEISSVMGSYFCRLSWHIKRSFYCHMHQQANQLT